LKVYTPKQGDFIALTFDPQSGHEQKGRRPALVLSKEPFNRATGLSIVCPLANTDRNFPFHVPVDLQAPPFPGRDKFRRNVSSLRDLRLNSTLTGFIMTEQVKSIDFKARKAKFIALAPQDVLNEVLAILDACLY
jgi:mRNA interferase MazF